MPGRFRAKAAVVAVMASAGALAFSVPASAIQTTTWGIQPAGGPRPSLSYPANGQTVHDAVIVYNRTAGPEVIDLSVLSASRANGSYAYSPARTGLAARVELAGSRITLGPDEQARVPVTIKMPSHSKVTSVAAISAEGAPVRQGSLLIQQQLVILVKATPSTVSSPIVRDVGIWGPIAGGLLAVVAGWLAVVLRRRRGSADGPVVVVAPTVRTPPDRAATDMAAAR